MRVRNGMIVRASNESLKSKVRHYKIVSRNRCGCRCVVRERIGNGVWGEPKELSNKELKALRKVIV